MASLIFVNSIVKFIRISGRDKCMIHLASYCLFVCRTRNPRNTAKDCDDFFDMLLGGVHTKTHKIVGYFIGWY